MSVAPTLYTKSYFIKIQKETYSVSFFFVFLLAGFLAVLFVFFACFSRFSVSDFAFLSVFFFAPNA